jgi:hypothetical protein
VALVLATVNPTQLSFVSWALDHADGALPLVVLSGVTLLILWVIDVRATIRSIGVLGVLLAAVFIGAIVWVLADAGLLDLSSSLALQWIVLAALGVVLGVGLSWSHVRRALSGQADVDDVDE